MTTDQWRGGSDYFDGEIGSEGPGREVVLGRAPPGGSPGGLQEGRSSLHGALDQPILIRLQKPRVEKALEGELEGDGGVREGEKRLQDSIHRHGAGRNPRGARGGVEGGGRIGGGAGTLGDDGIHHGWAAEAGKDDIGARNRENAVVRGPFPLFVYRLATAASETRRVARIETDPPRSE